MLAGGLACHFGGLRQEIEHGFSNQINFTISH